jgi:hypothetical protein
LLQFQVCFLAFATDAVIIRDEADRNSEKISGEFVGSQGVTGSRITGHNITSGDSGIEPNHDILHHHGGPASASSEPDGHNILDLQLSNSAAAGIGINMVPSVFSPFPIPVPQVVALVSPYQVPVSAAQGLQFVAASTADEGNSPVTGDVTWSSGQIAPISKHGTSTGLESQKRDQVQGSSTLTGSSGISTGQLSDYMQEFTSLLRNSNAGHIAQLGRETDNSGAGQATKIWPGYGRPDLGQLSSFRLRFNNIFPKYGYSLVSGISDLKDGSGLGSGTFSLGHISNFALGSEKNNIRNVLPNTAIHLESGYRKENAALDYENPNNTHDTSNVLGSNNSGIGLGLSSDNSNIFTGQPQKFSISAGQSDLAHSSNINLGSDIGTGSLFGTGKTSSNLGHNFGSSGSEQSTGLSTSSAMNIATFGPGFGHGSNVSGQDQSFHFGSGFDESDLGHTAKTESASRHESEVSSGKHPNLGSASPSFSASNHDLGNHGQRKISGSVLDLSNGAGLYFTALGKDSHLHSASSLSTLYHGSGRPDQENSLGSSATAGSYFTAKGKYPNSGSASIPSLLRHGPRFRAGSGGSNLGHISSRPTYSGTGSNRQSHAGTGNILGQGSSLQGQKSLVSSRYYGLKHAPNNLGHTAHREGFIPRYKPISNAEVGKGNSGFGQSSQPGIGFGNNGLGHISSINTGSSDSRLEQYEKGFGTGSLGSGSSSLGYLTSGNQIGGGSQISKTGSTATSTSNFNLGNYAVSGL